MIAPALILARVVGFGRTLPLRSWLIIGAGLATLLIALLVYRAGGDAVREDVADERAAVVAKAAPTHAAAATDRALDTADVADNLREWNHDAEQSPDAVPDDRELRRRCRQLRDAGRADLPACRGLAG